MEILKLAVERVFSQWTALKFAIEQGTAGNFHVCKQLHDELVLETMEYLEKGADESFIADLLFGRVEEDFLVSLEDESDRVVARLICEIYQRIKLGDLNVLNALPVISPKPGQTSVLQGDGVSDSSDDDMDTDDTPPALVTRPQKPQPDDDGWSTIPTRR